MNLAVKVDGRGKVTVVESCGTANLKLWALQNTSGKAQTYVVNTSGRVIYIVTGRGKDLPKVNKDPEGLYLRVKDGVATLWES